MKQIQLTFFLLLLSVISVQAQKSIVGKVIDQSSVPLPGVNVLIQGTSTGVTTDFDGNYSIKAKPDDILVFSYLGFLTQNIKVGNQSEINVVLAEDVAQIDEVVVVGYGTQKKTNLTGAVSSVNFGDVIEGRPETESARALQGAIPGLNVEFGTGRPGSTASLSIRGIAALGGGTKSPLVLLDNVPVDINDVNPNDIESISVLKDASASAIYGGRAAFGVVLITTKKGKRNAKPNFNYSVTTAISSATELAKPVSTAEFVRTLSDFGTISYWAQGQDIPTWLGLVEEYEQNPSAYPNGYAEVGGIKYVLRDNDVLGDFIDNTGFTQIHNFNVSGGAENISYRVSMGYTDEDGIMVTDRDSFKRYNLNGYIESDISDKLKFSLNTLYKSSNNSIPVVNYSNSTAYPAFSLVGNNEEDNIPYDTPSNVVRLTTPDNLELKNLRLSGKLIYEPLKDLVLTGEYTYENDLLDRKNVVGNQEFYRSREDTYISPDNIITSYTRIHQSYIRKAMNLYASYEKNLEKHNLSFLVGFNNETFSRENVSARVEDLIDPNLPFLSGATGPNFANDAFAEYALQGMFGRFKYNYDDRYLLEANGRYDGSSRFPRNDRFGFFPSFSAGWVISNEGFFEPLKTVVSDLKFRGSWGDIGNQDTSGFYPFLPGMDVVNAQWINPNTGLRYTTLNDPSLVSPSFTWERARTLNIGLDAGLFKNKLTMNLEWFNRQVVGILDDGLPLPDVLGTAAPQQNVSDIENKGWEITLGWKQKIGNDFSYYINANIFDIYSSKITNVVNNVRLIGNNNYIGKNYGEIWGLVTDGYFTVDDFEPGTLNNNLENGTLIEGQVYFQGQNPNPGDVKYVDLDGDGFINDQSNDIDNPQDRKVIGNNRKRYQFGASVGASYKGFDFSLRLVGVGKADRFVNNNVFFGYSNQFAPLFKHQLDYWTPENTDAFYPRNYQEGSGNYGRSTRFNTKYLSNAAYLTVQNITLGYTLPKRFVEKIRFNKVRVYFTAENPFMFDNMPDGIHPEFDNIGGGAVYPFRKQYGMGLNLTF